MIPIRQIAASTVLGCAIVAAAGCSSHERPDAVPMSAQELGTGRGEVTFNAADSGTVYVVDGTRKDVIYTGKVNRGDLVKVDAQDNQVMVNNVTVTERDLLNDHRYNIYFERDRNAMRGDRMADDPNAPQPAGTVIRTDPNARTTVTTDPNTAQPSPPPQAPPPAQQQRTTVTAPDGGKTTITTEPNAVIPPPPPPQPKTTVTTPDGGSVTTDPNTGTTTIREK
ncbi:MAG: hypothetical protein ABIP55_00270 [Tepidisphaeraceae bacterium]